MQTYDILFWVLSALAVCFALGVILSRNPVNSILFLILTFFAVSGHYLLMNAQFLFIVNLIVYAGAIMVLFLFVVMLMNLNADVEPQKGQLVQLAGVISGGMLFLVVLASVKSARPEIIERTSTDIGLIDNLGKVLFTKYVLPFEISSVLFLSAMIGAVVIGKKEDSKITAAKTEKVPENMVN